MDIIMNGLLCLVLSGVTAVVTISETGSEVKEDEFRINLLKFNPLILMTLVRYWQSVTRRIQADCKLRPL